jgi:hypothetical protein
MSSIPSRDTTAQAALYLRAFTRLVAEGRVVRERVLAIMYVRRAVDGRCALIGSDLGWNGFPLTLFFVESDPYTYRRAWRVLSLATGADVTWGLLGEISGVLDVNPAELEGKDALRWGIPAEGRIQRAQRQLQSMGRTSKLLEQLPMFKQAGACALRGWVWVMRLKLGFVTRLADRRIDRLIDRLIDRPFWDPPLQTTATRACP